MSVLHKHSLRLTPHIQHMCSHSFIRVMSTCVPFTGVLAIMWLQLCISSFLYVHVDTCSIQFWLNPQKLKRPRDSSDEEPSNVARTLSKVLSPTPIIITHLCFYTSLEVQQRTCLYSPNVSTTLWWSSSVVTIQ